MYKMAHFGVVDVDRAFLPVRDGVHGDLVALVVQLVDHGVVGVLVRHVEAAY